MHIFNPEWLNAIWALLSSSNCNSQFRLAQACVGVILPRGQGGSVIGPFVQMLSCYPQGDLVAEALHTGLFAPYGAISTTIWSARHSRELIRVGTHGNPNTMDDFNRRISIQVNVPVANAYREAKIMIRDLDEMQNAFNLLPDVPRMGPGGYVASPILLGGQCVGAFLFMRLHAHASAEVDVEFVQMVGYLLGLWMATTGSAIEGLRGSDFDTAPLSLTERQKMIVELMREGWTSEEIATQLGYSTSTVKQEVVRMKHALNVDSRQDLVTQALRLSLLP